ncbi:MAG: hypothetical protein IRY85_06735 [Micromonosporaceae bacterium]|nr:hypothetical protein [Micromonosporaceae bacterium]
MPSFAPPARRPITVALLVLAAVCLTLVVAALWNPWRLTALHPLATTGGAVAVLTLAGALVATTGLLLVAHTARRALIGLVVALVAVPAFSVGLPVLALGDTFRDRRIAAERVLATSPDEGYSVVALTYPDGATDLVVRSRRGLLSREGVVPVASCPYDPFSPHVAGPAGGLPPESVYFTAENRVAVPMVVDNVTVTVGFDGDTLHPERTIAMCDD